MGDDPRVNAEAVSEQMERTTRHVELFVDELKAAADARIPRSLRPPPPIASAEDLRLLTDPDLGNEDS